MLAHIILCAIIITVKQYKQKGEVKNGDFKNYDFSDLMDEVWRPAKDFMEKVDRYDLKDELIMELESHFINTPTMLEVNDFLGYSLDNDWILRNIDITDKTFDNIRDIVRDLTYNFEVNEKIDTISEEHKENEFDYFVQDNFWTMDEVIDYLDSTDISDIFIDIE